MRKLTLLAIVLLYAYCVVGSKDINDWKVIGRSEPDTPVTFYVALHQKNIDVIEKHLYEISDPKNSRYGIELKRDEIMNIIAPSKADHDRVVSWFHSQGVNKVVSLGDALKISAAVSAVEKILQTKLYTLKHNREDVKTIRHIDGFKIPAEIAEHVFMITGLSSVPYVAKNKSAKLAQEILQDSRVLSKRQFGPPNNLPFASTLNIKKVYNIPKGTAASSGTVNQCAVEFYPPIGAPLFSQLENFCKYSNETFTNITKIMGPWKAGYGNTESTLDVEMLMAFGPNVPIWYFSYESGWMYEMAVELFALQDPPQVVSISYAWPELDSCDSAITGAKCDGVSVDQWLNRTNIEFLKLGLRRVSLLAASGDQGAPGPLNVGCDNTTHPVFAMYPASSPYVTAVSGTTFMPNGPSYSNPDNNILACQRYTCIDTPVVEWPCMANQTLAQWTTGGGFSDSFSMPDYQKSFVQNYLNAPNVMTPPSKFFNANNRAYPDISAIGDRILTFNFKYVIPGAGTSASTPIISGVISLLNDIRAQQNKTPLGFLNPMLYQMYTANPNAYNDITVGDNHCGGANMCCYGYGATAGWDAVTGLGTPNYPAIVSYVKQLP